MLTTRLTRISKLKFEIENSIAHQEVRVQTKDIR